jgi:hypothetical protein
VLSARLQTATRNAALNLMISDQRRKACEAEALALNLVNAPREPEADWDRLRPLLDAAIDELPERDRAAVVLRFLEQRGFVDIGTALRVSEDAARMRTTRAPEKLRVALARRGITSTTAALGLLVSSQPIVAAPAGLAAALAAHSLTAVGSGVVATSFVSFMATKIITTALISGLVAFWIGTGVTSSSVHTDAPAVSTSETQQQGQLIASLRQSNQRLNTQVDALNSEVTQLKEKQAASAVTKPVTSPAVPVTKDVTLGMARWEIQQATLNNLKQIDAARKQFQLEKDRLAGSIHDVVGRQSYIKTVRSVNGEDYTGISMNPADPITVTSPSGISVTYDPSGATTTKPEVPPEVARVYELAASVQPSINQALAAYRAANNGKGPPNEQALVPFFPTPREGADFVEYVEAKKAAGL